MLNLLCAVWAWAATSANDLLDLANMGRDTNNSMVLAIAAGLAIVRVTAFLIIMVPAIRWLIGFILNRDPETDETRVRVWLILLLVASIGFEIFVTVVSDDGDDGTERSLSYYADYDGM